MYVLIYGVYIIVSLLLIFYSFRQSWQDRLIRAVVVATLPGVGWLLPIFWQKWLIRKQEESFEEYLKNQDEEIKMQRIGIYERMKRQQELDIIPIEDALIVSEHKIRRQVIIDVLKKDVINYLDILQRAVSNEDKETSYYAVSAIMEVKRKMQLAMQELAVKFETDSSDLQVVSTYADVLNAYMKSGFLDDRTLMKYRYTYLSVLTKLIELNKELEWPHNEIVDIQLTLQLYADANESAQLYLNTFPNSEDAYLCMMKVCYEMKSYERMLEVLNSLKSTPIKLSNHALTIVRFWTKGA